MYVHNSHYNCNNYINFESKCIASLSSILKIEKELHSFSLIYTIFIAAYIMIRRFINLYYIITCSQPFLLTDVTFATDIASDLFLDEIEEHTNFPSYWILRVIQLQRLIIFGLRFSVYSQMHCTMQSSSSSQDLQFNRWPIQKIGRASKYWNTTGIYDFNDILSI